MGTWGRRLFENDLACDVRDSYKENLKNSETDTEAYDKTLKEYTECLNSDEKALFWCALACTQWQLGRLTSELKEKALTYLYRKPGEGNDIGLSAAAISEIKTVLDTPMPERKRITKDNYITNPGDLGDVYAYRFHTQYAEKFDLKGKYILFQKVGDASFGGGPNSVIQFYNKAFDEVPDIDMVSQLSVLPLCYKNTSSPPDSMYMRALMAITGSRQYPKKHITFVGNLYVEKIDFHHSQFKMFFWDTKTEEWLGEFYTDWNGEIV